MYSTRSRSGVIGGCQAARTADKVTRVCSAARRSELAVRFVRIPIDGRTTDGRLAGVDMS
jgi:hypothetical protein